MRLGKYVIIFGMKKIFAFLLIAVAVAGCRRSDVREFSVHMPEMTKADVQLVGAALQKFGGIDKGSYVYDDEKKVLSLKYDSMHLAKKNIEIAIAKAGFTANGVTPESVGAKRKSAEKK